LKFQSLFKTLIIFLALVFIIYLSVSTRLGPINSPTVLDYDPWWQYRHAKDILENNLKVPKWDMLSFYPPGRPMEPFQGWPYTIIIFYKILQLFYPAVTLMKAAILSPLIMAALTPIPAFFLGRHLTNNIGGLAVALFSTLTPTFLGVSTAGYSDTDAVVVFYSFLCTLSVFLALKKKSIPFYIFAILANLAFAYNWGAGWLILLMFIVFIPTLAVFRVIEQIIHQKKLLFNIVEIKEEMKTLLLPLLIVLIVTNILGYYFGLGSALHSFLGGLAFTGLAGQPLIVNISVAELQLVNIFSREGFLSVAGRVGLLPTIFTLLGLPLLVFFKIYRKEKINFAEIFLFLWASITFYLILRGVRFSLLFSTAAAVSAGYVIGNLYSYLRNRNPTIFATVFGFILLLSLAFISDAIQFGYATGGMQISKNWYDMLDWLKENADKDALIATWWDPGHIIAGYTGLKVHADGAHCPPNACIPYNHNIRIQDMGRIFSTNDEEESVKILKKYMNLTPEQCQQAKEWLKDMPDDACKPVSEIYLIASSDLIGKYFWMSCFGSFDWKVWSESNGKRWKCDGRNFLQLQLSQQTAEGLVYGGIITLTAKENKLIPIINVPEQGIRNAIIKEIVFFQNGQEQRLNYGNLTNTVDGLLWVDPSFRMVIFMDPTIRDSVFTKLFFWNGQGLKHFQLVFSNPEIRLFKVIF
jgi:dolichyl-diphosphooligosaccharide--protein glycosyltransferase